MYRKILVALENSKTDEATTRIAALTKNAALSAMIVSVVL